VAHIDGEILIRRSAQDVFDFVADERNEPSYNPRMLRVEKTTSGPIAVGTTFIAETMTLGRTAEMTIEWTAYERPKRLASITHASSMEIDGALSFDAVPEGTRMRWTWELQPSGLLKVMAPIIARVGQRQEKAIWTNLKHLLEAQPAPA
jgi:hypothetical protein